MAPQNGNVINHASTMRFKTVQRTSEMRRLEAAPTMALVMVWVVESGMPYCEAPKIVSDAEVCAAKPCQD